MGGVDYENAVAVLHEEMSSIRAKPGVALQTFQSLPWTEACPLARLFWIGTPSVNTNYIGLDAAENELSKVP